MTTSEKNSELHGTTPEFEQRIARALELPVPELSMPELPEIDSDKVVGIKSATKPRRRGVAPVWLAMAASVALVAIVGVRMFGDVTEYDSLSEEILAHLDHEPYALRVTDEAVSDARLTRIVPSNLATLDHSAGLITYAQNCKIRGEVSPHLVIQGKSGPVTVILMPQVGVQSAETIEGESIHGVILPVGDGSIAIIGEKDEDLEPIQRSIIDSVAWST